MKIKSNATKNLQLKLRKTDRDPSNFKFGDKYFGPPISIISFFIELFITSTKIISCIKNHCNYATSNFVQSAKWIINQKSCRSDLVEF